MNILVSFEHNSSLKKKILIVLGFSIIVLIISEIWVVNHLATYGEKISKIEQTKQNLVTENMILEKQLAEKSALIKVESNAKKMGFNSNKNIEYIKEHNLALTH